MSAYDKPHKEYVWQVPPRSKRERSKAVLIADDDISSSRALALAFEDAGFVVNLAFTGIDAVSATKRLRPDVVLVDLLMPLGDGWQVADAVRASGNASMLIAHTSVSTYPEWEKCQQAGFDAFFLKPCTLPNLIGLMTTYCEQ